MPVVSKAQNAAMHASAEGHSTLGIPKKVGAEFVAATPKGSVKKLPNRVGKPKSEIGSEVERRLAAKDRRCHDGSAAQLHSG